MIKECRPNSVEKIGNFCAPTERVREREKGDKLDGKESIPVLEGCAHSVKKKKNLYCFYWKVIQCTLLSSGEKRLEKCRYEA